MAGSGIYATSTIRPRAYAACRARSTARYDRDVTAANTTRDSLVELTQRLVRIPSRARRDPVEPVLDAIRAWLREHGVRSTLLRSPRGRLVGLTGRLGRAHGPAYLLNAPADTAPVGDPATWRLPPTGGVIEDGWLHGRGSADSKSGVAILCHVLAEMKKGEGTSGRRLAFLFDGDEHSGEVSGVRQLVAGLRRRGEVAGALIAYPGHDRIVIGSRGIFRAALVVHGVGAHSGSSRGAGINAVNRAAALVAHLERLGRDLPLDGAFGLPPKVTVTAARGGSGFTTVPDTCTLNVDVRLTPEHDRAWAEALVRGAAARLDAERPASRPTEVRARGSWPAYTLRDDAEVVVALRDATRAVLGAELPRAVVGPSSVANYLSALGIAATSGFGVAYRNLHAADECIDLATLEPSFEVYLAAVRRLTT
jgi:succinyl-diaminopimelate desuccinylase